MMNRRVSVAVGVFGLTLASFMARAFVETAAQGGNRPAAPCPVGSNSVFQCLVIHLDKSTATSARPWQPEALLEGRGQGGTDFEDTSADVPPNSDGEQVVKFRFDTSAGHPSTHNHDDDPDVDVGPHCHYWMEWEGTWEQYHC